ncbi:hypothetical protein [Streptomyces sp. NPDC059008]|uniref:hypothetical protein n=1 Tax=Streptomyces sp. NPDC059008 TaxID=3346693 RepID=UPI00367CCF28
MDDTATVALYLARRDTYAALLNAVDDELRIAWHRCDGRYTTPDGQPDEAAAVGDVDRAYVNSRAKFNVIDLEGVGPVKEARALVERAAALHKGGGTEPNWADFKRAREAFVTAASRYLKTLLPEAGH